MAKKRFGDRRDGRLLRSLDPFYKFIPYIMVQKNDACNQFDDSAEITETDRWLRDKRKEGYKGLGYLHLFIAAYVRMVSQRPAINRFIAGRRIFARNNIEVVLTVRRGMTAEAGETTIKVVFDPYDTVFDVYHKMTEKIDEIKYGEEDNNTEQVASALTKLPRFVLRFALRNLGSQGDGLLRSHPAEPAGREPLPRLHDHHRPRLARHRPGVPPSVQLRQPARLHRLWHKAKSV